MLAMKGVLCHCRANLPMLPVAKYRGDARAYRLTRQDASLNCVHRLMASWNVDHGLHGNRKLMTTFLFQVQMTVIVMLQFVNDCVIHEFCFLRSAWFRVSARIGFGRSVVHFGSGFMS